ncbi:VOC family protein [Dyella sp.]|uniref:VOC family protein n=1 Tax=Dyella sp. TaxID=1869338 RepID=UPI002ED0F279
MIVNSYVMFDGNCEEAFQFYARCLDGKIEALIRYADMPECAGIDEINGRRVAHVRLKVGDCLLMGSDVGGPYTFEGYKGFSICINTADVAQAEKLFDALSEQATAIPMPLAKTSWSERYGQIDDRYGVSWMVNCDTRA